jgi:hypothetical protein
MHMQSRATLFVLAVTLALGIAVVAQAGTLYQSGDVFVSIGNGQVNEYRPDGTFVQNLNDGSGSLTTGMAFDASGNLYVTNFIAGSISRFDNSGNNLLTNWVTGQTNPESISMVNGAFPALVGDAGRTTIAQYSSSGGLLNTYTVASGPRGTDWVDLLPNGNTVLYTSEGTQIYSYNLIGGQNTPFATGLPGAAAYALREITSGTFAGYVLVADSSAALLLTPSGAIMTVYNLPGNTGSDFALNLDPTGNFFWTADAGSGEVWEVDIATGAIMEHWNSGFPISTFGLAVFGEHGQGTTPEPGTLIMFGSGVLGLAGIIRRKMNR